MVSMLLFGAGMRMLVVVIVVDLSLLERSRQ